MDESKMKQAMARIIEMIENVTQSPRGYLTDKANNSHADTDWRRVAALVGANIGIRLKIVGEVFGYKEARVNTWLGKARHERYGKAGYEQFTEVVDRVTKGIQSEFPDGFGTGDNPDSASAGATKKGRRPYKARKGKGGRKKSGLGDKAKVADRPMVTTITGDELSVTLYALASFRGVSMNILADTFNISTEEVGRRISDVHVRLSDDAVLHEKWLLSKATVRAVIDAVGAIRAMQ